MLNGILSVTFSLPKPTFTMIVLSQVDTRYFKEIAGISSWTLEFSLVKRGEKDILAEATPTLLYSRSVNMELELEAGEYVVYVCPSHLFFRTRPQVPSLARSELIVQTSGIR